MADDDVGYLGTSVVAEATEKYAGHPGASCLWFGAKANTKTFWSHCRLQITRFRVDGKALIVYGENQGMMPPRPENNEGEWKSLRYWKAYFPAKFCAVVIDYMVTGSGYRTYTSPEMMLQVKYPMWMKELKAYPCRANVVAGKEKDKGEA